MNGRLMLGGTAAQRGPADALYGRGCGPLRRAAADATAYPPHARQNRQTVPKMGFAVPFRLSRAGRVTSGSDPHQSRALSASTASSSRS